MIVFVRLTALLKASEGNLSPVSGMSKNDGAYRTTGSLALSPASYCQEYDLNTTESY